GLRRRQVRSPRLAPPPDGSAARWGPTGTAAAGLASGPASGPPGPTPGPSPAWPGTPRRPPRRALTATLEQPSTSSALLFHCPRHAGRDFAPIEGSCAHVRTSSATVG